MPQHQVTISQIIQDYGETLKATLYHQLPGVIVAYYNDGTADVQPAVNDVRFDPDTDARTSESFPIIPKVRIKWPSGGGYSITWPLQQGDKVTLRAYDLDPTVHQATGNVEDPADVRRHGGTYWQIDPGDCTDAGPTATAGQITITGPGNIALGSATDFVALAGKIYAELQNVANAFATFLPGSGGASFPHPYVAPGSSGALASDKVKA